MVLCILSPFTLAKSRLIVHGKFEEGKRQSIENAGGQTRGKYIGTVFDRVDKSYKQRLTGK